MLRRFFTALAALWLIALAQPAMAAVTITFWSHEQDQDFPHAFFALNGVPDAGGAMIDANYGFTAKTITPAILLGTVAGEVEPNKRAYMGRSDAQFSVVLTDAQLADVQALIAEWNADAHYNLNKRNCVHFVAEALHRSGVTVPDLPKLMKKPTSFLRAVGEANVGRVTPIHLAGDVYFAQNAPVVAAAVVDQH